MFMEYEPADYIARIAPTPLLMIVSECDTRVSTELQLDAYARARESKKLTPLLGGHYEPYIETFVEASAASRNRFVEHLPKGVIKRTPSTRKAMKVMQVGSSLFS
jgi:uncharacterized protein